MGNDKTQFLILLGFSMAILVGIGMLKNVEKSRQEVPIYFDMQGFN